MPDSQTGLSWFSKNLIEILPAAVYICDADGVIVAFNLRAAELWGRSPNIGITDEKFCGSHRLYRPDGTLLPHVETPMESVLRTGEAARDQEVIIERPDGSRVTVLVNIVPLVDGSGVRIGAVNCFQDLSAQKHSEQERMALREELRQSQKLEAMGQLVGGVAHDFNNLLTPIIGSLELLHRGGVQGQREQRLIDRALQSAERAETLVKRLLAYARRQPLYARPAKLSGLVTGMADLIRSVAGPHIALVIDVAATLPEAMTDPSQLEMTILNLCVNARDAMPEGGTLRISAVEETIPPGHPTRLAPGRYLRLSIADTGAGMDAATVARATEPFFSTKGVGKGTGLGLSMAEGLVSQLGGALVLTSELRIGTAVVMFLPVSAVSVASVERVPLAVSETKFVGRVLLVDDEYLVRLNTADMLADLGYEVVEASSGEEALRVLAGEPGVDVVVTDHLMPGMTGGDLARAIRERHPGTPLLIVSGFPDAEDIAADVPRLAKPFRRSDLVAGIAGVLQAEK